MKRLVLHLGMRKTGSSTLQATLGGARPQLRELGIHYPPFRPYNHSFQFQVLFLEKPAGSYYYKQLSPISDSDWQAEMERLRAQWREFFSSAESGTFIISAENLPAMSVEEIGALQNFVAPFFDKVTAFVYVRHPLDAIRSQWEQDIKELIDPRSPQEVLAQTIDRFSYRALNRWGRVLGDQSMIVRPFDRRFFHGGSLLTDFFHHLGLDVPPDMHGEGVHNASLGREGVAFLQAFNARFPQYRDGVLNPQRGLTKRLHIFYDVLRRVPAQPLDFSIHFEPGQAEYINRQIGIPNRFLAAAERFAPVTPSEGPTLLPTPEEISLEYCLELVNQLALQFDDLIEGRLRRPAAPDDEGYAPPGPSPEAGDGDG